MSKINEQLNSENVLDTYQDHPTHLVYRSDCSECYSNPPVVEYDKEEGIALMIEKELEEDNEESEFDCKLCGDTGFISSGFEDDNNEFNKTGSRRCECNVE